MVSPHAKPYAVPAILIAAAIAILLIILAKEAAAQTHERMWTVTCGLPKQDNPLFALLPGGYSGPWFGDTRSGHLKVKKLHRLHPEGGVSTELWLLSRAIGWWRLKALRVHPEDRSKLPENVVKGQSLPRIR